MRHASWNPYLVGLGIAVLSVIAFVTADHPLGITTAYEHTASFVVTALAPEATSAYHADESPVIGWEWMLVLGVFLGAALSARLGRDRDPLVVPPLWSERFGPSRGKRLVTAFAGGALMLFGARLASGCTSGHGISGNLQLAVSSIVFSATFALAAVLTAKALYGRREGAS